MKEKLISILFAAIFLILFSNMVLGTATISISGVTIPSSVTQGDSFTITMSVSEGSVGSTEDVSGSLSLPSGISCTPSGSQTISLSGGSGSASWACSASVAGDYSSQITATVNAKDSSTKASLSDTEITGLTVLSPASLTVSSTFSSSSVAAGSSVTFTVGINNVGDSSTTFNISLDCPTGLTCSPSSVGNTVISGSSLSNNQFTITGGTAGSYTLTATVQSPVQSDLITSQDVTVTSAGTTTTTSGGGGPSGGTVSGNEKVTKSFASILAGVEKIIATSDLVDTGTQLTEISMILKNKASSVSITVEKISGQPSNVTAVVSGQAYRYIKVTKSNLDDSNIDKLKIDFKVEKTWVSNNSIDLGTIALYRYSNGWVKLNTTKLSDDNYNYYFEAESPGLSYFAISGTSTSATTVTTQPSGLITTTISSATTSTVSVVLPGKSSLVLIYLLIAIVAVALIIFLSWKVFKKKS